MRLALPAVTLVAAAVVGAWLTAGSGTGATTLVALRADAPAADAAALEAVGAAEVDARLRLYEAPATARRTVGALEAAGAVRYVQPVRRYLVTSTAATTSTTATTPDPLSGDEWWRAAVGVSGLTPPGPGIPITVVDSGLDVGHPEFVGRPGITLLNPQLPAPVGGTHGTMVGSLIGAPVNGVGFIGIYPESTMRIWDAAPSSATQLDSAQIVEGILNAVQNGRGVVNLSLGGERDLAIEDAISQAVARGLLLVAASGNDGDQGDQLSYPASLPHVLTVAATTRDDQVAPFSSYSNWVDVAAPGDGVLVAETLRGADGSIIRDWSEQQGTSFAAPLVSGAAAWIWTARPTLTADQVAEVIRRSARDIGAPGRDVYSGYGILDVAKALTYPTPVADVGEPNDDVDNVAPDGERNFARPSPLTTRTVRTASLQARLDRWEDPADVYRVWLPARATVTMTSTGTADTNLALYRTGVPSVSSRFVGSYRLARGQAPGKTERLRYANGRTGRWAYVAVTPGRSTVDATYRLVVTTR